MLDLRKRVGDNKTEYTIGVGNAAAAAALATAALFSLVSIINHWTGWRIENGGERVDTAH